MKPMKQVLLAGIESSYGSAATLTGAANALLVQNAQLTPMVQDKSARSGLRAFLGSLGQIVVGQHVGLNYDCEIAGSGSAGSAPAWGPLLRACGMAETINATAITGTAQAGAAGTITLEAADAGATDAYKHLLIEITGGTGAGQTGRIRSNDGTSKVATMYENWTTQPDATSTYSILPQVVYAPVSSGEESRSNEFNIDGLQHSMTGVLSDLAMKFAKSAPGLFSLKDLGLYATPTDTALPTADLSGQPKPLAVNQANTVATLHGYAAIFTDISLALNNANTYMNRIGSERIEFTDRKPNGSVTFEHPTIAAKDFYSICAAETLGSLNVTHGTAAGARVGVYCPAVQLIDPAHSVDTVLMQGLSLDVQPLDGNDELLITAY